MEHLWRLWKAIFCGDSNRAKSAALFMKKYVFCGRSIYIPTTPRKYNPEKPFFIDGDYITAEIYGYSSIEMRDRHFRYRFYTGKTLIESHNKEDTWHFAICCGCPVIDPEDNFAPLNSRSVVSRTVPREEDFHVLSLALDRIAEIDSETPVGMFHANTWQNADPKEDLLLAQRMHDELKSNKFKVPFLGIRIAAKGYKPWVEYVEFKHLSLKTKETVEITEKMLNCGYLSVTAPISNPEELINFKGFALIFMSKNGFTWDRILEEVKLSKRNNPSQLECFGLFDKENIPSVDEFWSLLEPYSPTGKITTAYDKDFEGILLDDVNDAAILFVFQHGICFVRGGWKKWIRVFGSNSCSLLQ